MIDHGLPVTRLSTANYRAIQAKLSAVEAEAATNPVLAQQGILAWTLPGAPVQFVLFHPDNPHTWPPAPYRAALAGERQAGEQFLLQWLQAREEEASDGV